MAVIVHALHEIHIWWNTQELHQPKSHCCALSELHAMFILGDVHVHDQAHFI